MIKHVGMHKNLGTRYVIVFREVPNDPENCLIVESDGLSALIQDNLMNAIESTECQAASHLGEALARKSFATGENMLQYLHVNGLMRKVPVEDVILTPTPGTRVGLKEVNAIINGTEQKSTSEEKAEVKTDTPVVVDVTASLAKLKTDANMSDGDFAKALTTYAATLDKPVTVKVKAPRKKSTKVKSA